MKKRVDLELCQTCVYEKYLEHCNILEDKNTCLRFQCDICTFRENPNNCAMGVGDINDPICPGFSDKPCEECGSYPCICNDNDILTMMKEEYYEKGQCNIRAWSESPST